MTEITLENEDGVYIVRTEDEGLNAPEMVLHLVVPVLRAAGYLDSSIKDAFDTYIEY